MKSIDMQSMAFHKNAIVFTVKICIGISHSCLRNLMKMKNGMFCPHASLSLSLCIFQSFIFIQTTVQKTQNIWILLELFEQIYTKIIFFQKLESWPLNKLILNNTIFSLNSGIFPLLHLQILFRNFFIISDAIN